MYTTFTGAITHYTKLAQDMWTTAPDSAIDSQDGKDLIAAQHALGDALLFSDQGDDALALATVSPAVKTIHGLLARTARGTIWTDRK